MNILADFRSALQSINQINKGIQDFESILLEFSALKLNPKDTNIARIRKKLSEFNIGDLLLLTSNVSINNSQDFKSALIGLIETHLIPNKHKREIIRDLIIYAMRCGSLEDKEIIEFWHDRNVEINISSLRYQVKLLLRDNDVMNRSSLLRKLKKH